ncbi:hypothetical protein IWQ61_000859 [Dispira simplex]|nr:hypothetical protein IWQ61_000859 [Dispira simplex]
MQTKFTIRILLVSAIAFALASPCNSQPISNVSHSFNESALGGISHGDDVILPSKDVSRGELHTVDSNDQHPGQGNGLEKQNDNPHAQNGPKQNGLKEPLTGETETTTTATNTASESITSTATDSATVSPTMSVDQVPPYVAMDNVPIIDKPRPLEVSPDQVKAEKLETKGVCDPLTKLQQSSVEDYQLVVSCKDTLAQHITTNPGATLPFSLTKESLGCITGSQAYHAFEALGDNVECNPLLSA